MPTLTVAAAALNQTPLDWEGNKQRIIAAAIKAGDAAIVCFPELCICGYGCEDLFLAPWVRARSAAVLTELLATPELRTGGVYILGLPVEHGGKIFDAVAVIQSGKLLGITCKKHLDNTGIHYEQRWFNPWPIGLQEECSISGLPPCPIGDVWYDFDGVSLGLEICHDAWVEERHSKQLAERGVRIICNPSASHFAFGKRAIREQLVRSASREHCDAYVYANMLGCESGRAIYGGDCLISTGGLIRASHDCLSLAEYTITRCTVEIAHSSKHPVGFFGARKHPATRGMSLIKATKTADEVSLSDISQKSSDDALLFEEFTRAVTLGLFDYSRKSGMKRFALSLSGGADSTACAVLVDLMGKRINKELSKDRITELFPDSNGNISTKSLLTCAYQATKQSSFQTLESARAIAKAIDVQLLELDVDPLVNSFVSLAEKHLNRQTSWDKDDLALQNIQSRVRAPSIWLIANLTNSLLLTTANRSEVAVGYATMDGDTSGGLAPLGGIDKNFIRSWLRWMEAEGPMGFGSYPSLKCVNELDPSAELRPGGTQTDEGDLMPYDVLAALERAAVRYYRSPDELLEILKSQFESRYEVADLERWRTRFIALFFRSQWKRERYAPAFHLDDFSLDPKTWLRMPILSKAP